jgi:CubicO group peptidase (beta-lactamase class C family)
MLPLEMLPDQQFQLLCERIRAEMKRLKIPGAALGLALNGQEFSAGFGKTSLEHPLPVTPETLFQAGSITKTFTGTLLMRLVEQGRLELDTPIRKILPKFKMSDHEVEKHLTTRHLLTHTGGWIGDYFETFGDGDDALQKMVKRIRKLPQITPLGQAWSYNNTGFNLAGRIIEIVTGLPYERAARELLLEPLGLEMTFFFPNDIMITHRFVSGHKKVGKKVQVARPWAIGRAGNCVGGIITSVRDLLRYAHFHMGNGTTAAGQALMQAETLAAMRVPQVDAGGRGQMGLTWFIRHTAPGQAEDLQIYGHGGATNGQQAALHFIPQKNFVVALLTNSDEGGILTDKLLQWVLEIYFGAALPSPTTVQKTEEELTEYTGRYDLPLSSFELSAENGILRCKDIPRGGFPTPDSPPNPPEPDVRFAFYDTDRVIGLDEPRLGARCEFLRDANGQISLMRLGGRLHPKISG